MGCACVKPSKPGDYITFPSKGGNSIEEETARTKSAVKIQSSFRALKSKRQIQSDRSNIIKNYNEQIKKDQNTTQLTNEEFENLISPTSKVLIKLLNEHKNELISSKIIKESDIIDIDNNSNSMLSFKTLPLKNNTSNEIYDGMMKYDSLQDSYYRSGKARIITSNKDLIHCQYPQSIQNKIMNSIIFYSNGSIFIGTTSTDNPQDNLLQGIIFYQPKDNNFSYYTTIDNKEYKTIYLNNDIYEGEGLLNKEHVVIPEGKGVLTMTNSFSRYEGEFKNGKFNGKGVLFVSDSKENEEKGIGKYTTTIWFNGKENGHGEIRVKGEDNIIKTECIFRFGKIIQSFKKVINSKIKLSNHIIQFLDPLELYLLFKKIKSKAIFEYIKNNKQQVQFAKLILSSSNITEENPSKIKYNMDILNLKLSNFTQILKHYSSKKIQYLPMVGYLTNGGIVETRYHYNNIFNPDESLIYTTHYLLHCKSDINIEGTFIHKFIEENSTDDDKNILIKKNTTFSDNDLLTTHLDDFIQNPKEYIAKYNELENVYNPVDKFRAKIDESDIILSSKILGNNYNKVFFCLHYLSIHIPNKIEIYTIVNSPCHFLAVYLLNKPKLENENYSVTNAFLNEFNEDLKSYYQHCKSKNIPILSFTENENYSYIEFDSKKTSVEEEKRLVCLIELKQYTEEKMPYLIKLSKYYHFGKYITVKLINQNLLFEQKKKTCIDFGTINCFGEQLSIE